MLLLLLLTSFILGSVSILKQSWVRNILRVALNDEAMSNNATEQVLLTYANQKVRSFSFNIKAIEHCIAFVLTNQYGCCGVDSTVTCDIDYPPQGKCLAGSKACQKGCLSSIWKNSFQPYLTVLGVFFMILAAVLVSLLENLFFLLNVCHVLMLTFFIFLSLVHSLVGWPVLFKYIHKHKHSIVVVIWSYVNLLCQSAL